MTMQPSGFGKQQMVGINSRGLYANDHPIRWRILQACSSLDAVDEHVGLLSAFVKLVKHLRWIKEEFCRGIKCCKRNQNNNNDNDNLLFFFPISRCDKVAVTLWLSGSLWQSWRQPCVICSQSFCSQLDSSTTRTPAHQVRIYWLHSD